jgi:hypothetical protein
MRVTRLLVLVFVALLTPLSRGFAQTCQGTAAFQDGRLRAGVFAQENRDVNDAGVSLAYGSPRSFYGEVSFDKLQASQGHGEASGPGLAIGYQLHLSDTPFQFCPEATAHYSASDGIGTLEYGVGGNLGYRIGISDWFTLVPAAGIRWFTATGTSDRVNVVSPGIGTTQAAARGSGSEVHLEIGLVFNTSFSIVPGLLVPSQNGTKSIFTLGASINWAK